MNYRAWNLLISNNGQQPWISIPTHTEWRHCCQKVANFRDWPENNFLEIGKCANNMTDMVRSNSNWADKSGFEFCFSRSMLGVWSKVELFKRKIPILYTFEAFILCFMQTCSSIVHLTLSLLLQTSLRVTTAHAPPLALEPFRCWTQWDCTFNPELSIQKIK